jgi:hypothetical protein
VRDTEAGSVGTTEHTEYTEARGNRLRVVFRGRVEGNWYLSNSSETQGKHSKVRFLSSPLVNPGFPRVFRILGQLLWLSVPIHACRCCPCRNHRLVRCLGPQKHFSASSSESQESFPNPRFFSENMWFFGGGAGFELGQFESCWNSLPEQRCRGSSRRPSVQDD